MLIEIKSILDVESHKKELLVSTQQKVYIKAFVEIYLLYLSVIISTKTLTIAGYNENMIIGYAVTIEKILLQRLYVTENDIRDMVYVTDMIKKDDSNKKLRIAVREEMLFPVIQQSFSLKFPVKSFFVIAQLYEDYVQLTLNQVVTESNNLDDEYQESIILQDEIIPIRNIYDDFCFYMWNNITKDKSLIQLCDIHKGYNSDELLEIFSLGSQMEFIRSFRQHISKNVSSL
jgi:hypothetical protein